MKNQRLLSVAGATLVCCLVVAFANSPKVRASGSEVSESSYALVDRNAIKAKTGDVTASREIAHQLFKNIGVPVEIADILGFTDRVANAEHNYRQGQQRPAHESDIVNAVNNLAGTVGAPQWARTSASEVQKLRMHMLPLYPHLIARQGPPDAQGHYKALDDNISPGEAAFIAGTLVYQKIYNADYQFTDTEKSANAKRNAEAVNAAHWERTKTLRGILNGTSQSVSLRDILAASDHFFGDLGIGPTVSVSQLDAHHSAVNQGGK